MARLDTSPQDHQRFLSVMECDLDQSLQDRLADWRYKARLVRHSGLSGTPRSSVKVNEMFGWQ